MKEKIIFDESRFIFLDGAMGTMLQKNGLQAGEKPELFALQKPEIVTAIHRAYVEAGSNIISTNTFGANALKLTDTGISVQTVIESAVHAAKKACEGTDAHIALDVGPLGELLEPSGTLSFEKAYDLFTEVMVAGAHAGADLILIETMTDLYEAKAALLAAKENTSLPVLISMTFEENGRTFSGTSVEAMALTLSPLGAAAIGINCSLGPAEIIPLAKRLSEMTKLPVFMKPNAGLPDPMTGLHELTPEAFCEQMKECISFGISMIGGCCGTTPEMISMLVAAFQKSTPNPRKYIAKSRVCSSTHVLEIDGIRAIGERINPTGKKRLKQELKNNNLSYVQAQAVSQQDDDADILDVNVGTPEVDEVVMLPAAVKAVQAVTGLPLQLDSSNPVALEAALRVYNGKAIVNSTSAEQDKMDVILPLCKKYGAAIVGLTLDENGIPDTPEGRFALAEKIMTSALKIGIPREDIYIDCLVLPVSASAMSAEITLEALRMVKEKLGLKTLLGVSNISFGLPSRPMINQTFLVMAMKNGLDLPILNPSSPELMSSLASFKLLTGQDEGAEDFIAKFGEQAAVPSVKTEQNAGRQISLDSAIEKGLKKEAGEEAKHLLSTGMEGLEIVNQYLMPALDRVGKGFEKGTLYLPQLLGAAGAAQAAFDVIRSSYGSGEKSGPPIVLATVKGDIHDIGKNIVKVLLENYGYDVIDLGRDVPPEQVAEAVKKSGAKLVGLSALMTTTLPAMAETIQLLRAEKIDCKIVVGGAVLTEEYAMTIGADFYAKDAMRSVEIAKVVYCE